MARLSTLRPRVAVLDTRAAKPAPKQVDPYYLSAEHKAWRAAVLRRARYACEKCGRAGHDVRLFADHIVEIRDGGAATDPANGQCLCGACHTRKTTAERAARHAR